MYKNGKEEIEYIHRLIKEIFPHPFNFSVVNHANDDLKLILPQGITIYFHSRQQFTEFNIMPGKTIFNWHQKNQVEMKFKHPRKGEIV